MPFIHFYCTNVLMFKNISEGYFSPKQTADWAGAGGAVAAFLICKLILKPFEIIKLIFGSRGMINKARCILY